MSLPSRCGPADIAAGGVGVVGEGRGDEENTSISGGSVRGVKEGEEEDEFG